MLRIDPEEGEEDGEVKPVKIKIDQNLFTYAAKAQKGGNDEQMNSAGHVIQSNAEPSGVHQTHNPDMQNQQYAVISNQNQNRVSTLQTNYLSSLKHPRRFSSVLTHTIF